MRQGRRPEKCDGLIGVKHSRGYCIVSTGFMEGIEFDPIGIK